MTYPGGKGGEGVYQRIINLIPPHRVYIEAFAGHAAVLSNKLPAASTIAIDADADVCAWLRSSPPIKAMRACTVVCGDAIRWLHGYAWRGDEFVYCDPPYLAATRCKPRLYRHELSDDRHLELLSVLAAIPAAVMISGYPSTLYDEQLGSWHRVDYQTMTRGGWMADECLWLNYRPPSLLHDSRYLGDDFRERERIKRKRRRWVSNLMAMPPAERNAIFSSLVEAMRDRVPEPSSKTAVRSASPRAASAAL